MREKIYKSVRVVFVLIAAVALAPAYAASLIILALALPFSYALTNPKDDYRFDKDLLFVSTIVILAIGAFFSPVIYFAYRDANYTIAQESLPDFIAWKEKLDFLYLALWYYILVYLLSMVIMIGYDIKTPKFLYFKWLFKPKK